MHMSLSHDINPDAVRRYVALIEICNKLIRRYIEPCEEGVWLSFFFFWVKIQSNNGKLKSLNGNVLMM